MSHIICELIINSIYFENNPVSMLHIRQLSKTTKTIFDTNMRRYISAEKLCHQYNFLGVDKNFIIEYIESKKELTDTLEMISDSIFTLPIKQLMEYNDLQDHKNDKFNPLKELTCCRMHILKKYIQKSSIHLQMALANADKPRKSRYQYR